MEQGWDNYQAKPTDTQLASRLLGYLFTLMQRNSTPPVITPLADGGVQAEWQRNNQVLEIVVTADEPATYYYSNPAAHEEEEQQLEHGLMRVRDLISHF